MKDTSQIGVLVVRGSFQSLGILRSLANHGIPTYLIDWDFCIGRFSLCTNRFSKCPPVSDEKQFLKFLQDLAVRENIRGWVVFPNDDRTVELLAKHKKELEELYRIPVPSWEIAQMAYDKRFTYRLAEQIGISIPKTSYIRDVDELERLDVEFPAIIKPAIRDNFYDKVRKKAIRVDNRAQLIQEYLKAATIVDRSELMIQEYIPGGAHNLYSFGSLYRDGQVLGRVVAHRLRQHPAQIVYTTPADANSTQHNTFTGGNPSPAAQRRGWNDVRDCCQNCCTFQECTPCKVNVLFCHFGLLIHLLSCFHSISPLILPCYSSLVRLYYQLT